MNRYDCAVDERVFEVRIFAHSFEKVLENAPHRPATEAPELAVPVAEGQKKISLG